MTEVVEWIDPDGTTTTLEHMSFSNRFMPRMAFQADEVPGQPGERFREVEHGAREFGVVFDVVATGDGNLRTAIREMVAKLDPKRGAGKIRVTSPLGDQREIECHYSSGAELAEKVGEDLGPDFQRFPAVFIAHDPYWYDVSPQVQDFAVEPLVPSFFPFGSGGASFIKLTASELALDTSVENTGDVETWPVWTIVGPGSVIKLSNLSTNRATYFPAGELTAGMQLTIDTRPGRKTVELDDGTNAYTALDSLSSLWPLQRGTNVIRLEMGAVDVATSKLSLKYWRRYLSP